jgi:potassium/hydrogen antiporter
MAVPANLPEELVSETQVDVALLVGAAVLLVAIGAVRLSLRVGVPGLLVYLGIGMALGDNGIGLHFNNADQARAIGLVALALILAEGGLATNWAGFRDVLPQSAVLATVGVAVSVAVTSAIAYLVLPVDWRTAIITGAVVSSTDVAAVFATLRELGLPTRLVGVLEAESGLNDAPTVILVTVLASRHQHGALYVVGAIGYELVVGMVIGLAIGVVATAGLQRAALPAASLYPIATLAFAIASYAAAASAHASGFLAVYLTTVWLGRARLPHRRVTLGFAEGIAWLAQIGLFVMLGLLAVPSRLGSALLPALAIGFGLLLVARPLSVLASTTWFRMPLRDQAFVSWAGLRGAVPIVLTTVPLSAGARDATKIFDTVVVLVIAFTLVQSPLLAPLARWLRLDAPLHSRALSVESAPLDDLYADLIEVTIGPRSRVHNVEVWELRLPAGAAVSLVVRDDHAFVPAHDTVLQHGDRLLIVTTRADRAAAEERLQAVSRGGRLARFLGVSGISSPE